MKYTAEFRKEFHARPVFTLKDARIVLSQEGISNAYSKLLIHNLLKKGEIKRITKGIYTFSDELEIVGFGFHPFYYGLQEALSLRNLWEQETNPVVITPRKVRCGVRKFLGNNYVVRRITRKLFFGFELVKYYDFWIPVSDVEKTLIDFVYFGQPLPKDALEEMKPKIRKDVLDNYLKRYSASMKKKIGRLLAV